VEVPERTLVGLGTMASADGAGLGKTIEAGLDIQEMLIRNRAWRVLTVCPAPLTRKWRELL